MQKIFITILLAILDAAAFSQAGTPVITFTNPSSVSRPKGYSHAADISLGNYRMVMISGQVAVDSNGSLVGKGDIAKQSEQVFINIRNILLSLGGTMDHVAKISVFMTDISQFGQFREVRGLFVNAQNPPASTLVQVCKLAHGDFLLEVEAMAIIPVTEK